MKYLQKSFRWLLPFALAAAFTAPFAASGTVHAASFTLQSFSAPTFRCTNNVWSGTVTVSGGFKGTLEIKLMENPHQVDTATPHAFVTFTGASDPETESYTFSSIVPNASGNKSYIAQAIGATDTSGNDVTSSFGSSLNTKSGSYQCNSTTASAYSHMTVRTASSVHSLRWYSAQHVLGFNVYAGNTKLNRSLVTSTSRWFTFSTTHATNHLKLRAVLQNGTTR
jgi:hypothetical protein